MGQIQQEVQEHLRYRQHEERLIQHFTHGFDITWARDRKAYNTRLSIYFLKPDNSYRETFGLDRELLLAISNYPTLEARTFQAIETVLSQEPALGRVNQSLFFLICKPDDGKTWVDRYTTENPQSRIPVVFTMGDLSIDQNVVWEVHLRNIISDQLFTRDLFDYSLPLANDLYFFGRDGMVAEHIDAIRRSENRGIFGLRKTGKTSLLYKLQRIVSKDKNLHFIYINCMLPSIRQSSWENLLLRLVEMLMGEYNISKSVIRKWKESNGHISDLFLEVARRTKKSSSLCIAFDEIEYISPLSEDSHWKKDFVPFWQTLWSVQSEVRRVSFVIAGVNPTIVENDMFDSSPNPIFGIVKSTYVKGLETDSLRTMVGTLGKRMGLHFTDAAIRYLYDRYGGHPLLTRKACSYVDSKTKRLDKPIAIDTSYLRREEDDRDAELTFYCRHVVSALQKYYADEYEMLEMLATNQEVDFYELAKERSWTRHLSEYGLVDIPKVGRPKFAIPVIERYIRMERMRVARSTVGIILLPAEKREGWLNARKTAIVQNVRTFCAISQSHSLPQLYKGDNIGEVERFLGLELAQDQRDIDNFANVMYRSFIEPVRHRKRGHEYFENEVRQSFPDFWLSLDRLRIYRHKFSHQELTPDARVRYESYMERDFGTTELEEIPEYWFAFQQLILDEVLLTLTIEIDKHL